MTLLAIAVGAGLVGAVRIVPPLVRAYRRRAGIFYRPGLWARESDRRDPSFLLAAMREVDAMLPGSPPIAPPEQPAIIVYKREPPPVPRAAPMFRCVSEAYGVYESPDGRLDRSEWLDLKLPTGWRHLRRDSDETVRLVCAVLDRARTT